MILTFFLVSLLYLFIILLEVPRLVSQKKWRELAAFSVLLLPAVIYSYAMIFQFEPTLPNPSDIIAQTFKPLAKKLEQLLSTGY